MTTIEYIPNLVSEKPLTKVDDTELSTSAMYYVQTLLGNYENIAFAQSYNKNFKKTIKVKTSYIKNFKTDDQGYLEVYMNPGVLNSCIIKDIFNQQHKMISMFTRDSKGNIQLHENEEPIDKNATQYKLWCTKIMISDDLVFDEKQFQYQEETQDDDDIIQIQILKGIFPVIYTKDQPFMNIYRTITRLFNADVTKKIKYGDTVINYINKNKDFIQIGHQYQNQPILVISKDNNLQLNTDVENQVLQYSSWLVNNNNYDYEKDDLRKRQVQSSYLIDVINQIQLQPMLYKTIATEDDNIIKIVIKTQPNKDFFMKIIRVYEVVLADDQINDDFKGLTTIPLNQLQDMIMIDLPNILYIDPCLSLGYDTTKKFLYKNNLQGILDIIKKIAQVAAPIASVIYPPAGDIVSAVADLIPTDSDKINLKNLLKSLK